MIDRMRELKIEEFRLHMHGHEQIFVLKENFIYRIYSDMDRLQHKGWRIDIKSSNATETIDGFEKLYGKL
jgi:hypothetical protein